MKKTIFLLIAATIVIGSKVYSPVLAGYHAPFGQTVFEAHS